MVTDVIQHARLKQIPIVLLTGLSVTSVGIVFDVPLKHVMIITQLMVSGAVVIANRFFLNGFALEELIALLIYVRLNTETVSL